MAKYINNKIKSGRVAGSVFAVRYGEVIERAYNPYVSNPKSEAQVEARAKLKLLSQLSSVVAPVLAMPREGAKTPRNRFVAANYELTTYNNMQADIPVTSIKLTNGIVGLPVLVLTRTAPDLGVRLGTSAGIQMDSVTYAMFIKGRDGGFRYAGSKVVTEAGGTNTYATTFTMGDVDDTFVILAYGMRFNTEAARVKYGDMQTLPAEAIAKLIVTRVLLESDITLTETVGAVSNPA